MCNSGTGGKMTEIKKGDKVVVLGEGSSVFDVRDVTKTSVILDTGCAEPIEKCTLIPKKYYDKIYSYTVSHLDSEVLMKLWDV
jgi:hypothetical protein